MQKSLIIIKRGILMREFVKDSLKVIDGCKKSDKFDAKNSKMTSPIQHLLSEINKEKVKNKFTVADILK